MVTKRTTSKQGYIIGRVLILRIKILFTKPTILNRTIASHRSNRSLARENQQNSVDLYILISKPEMLLKVSKLLVVCFKKK